MVKTTFTFCDYELKVPAGATFDPSEIVLTSVTAGPPKTSTLLVNVANAAACAGQPLGWYFADISASGKVILCESKCQTLESSDVLSIDYGCK